MPTRAVRVPCITRLISGFDLTQIRAKLIQKQMVMEKSEKAKKLRELRKYGKKVQVEVLQKRQKEKKAMMTAVKKYQRGLFRRSCSVPV